MHELAGRCKELRFSAGFGGLFEGVCQPDQSRFGECAAEEGDADREFFDEAGGDGDVRVAGDGGH